MVCQHDGKMKKKCIILTISVVLNILLIGVVVGHLSNKSLTDRPELSDEGRGIMKETFKNKRGEIKKIVKDVKAKKQMLKDIVAAEEFDEKAYDEAAKIVVETSCNVSAHKLETFKGLMKQLSQEDRVKVADFFLENILMPKPRHKGNHDKKWREKSEQKDTHEVILEKELPPEEVPDQ